MKILVLMTYYNRPILVRRALQSILDSHQYHTDWHLAFGDDGSPCPGEPVVREMLAEHPSSITCVNTKNTVEDKLRNGISIGRHANQVILNSDADLIITLSDDDVLVPTYMRDISAYFETHSDVMYAWSKIYLYNPFYESTDQVNNLTGKYNDWTGPLNPANKLDASQVAYRVSCFKKHGVRYPESTLENDGPAIKNLDASVYEEMHEKFGLAPETGLVSQYKGIHDHQLVWHKQDLPNYIKKIDRLAGKIF